MRLVRIGLGCISPRVGDVAGNRQLLRQVIQRAREAGVTLLCTPELGICGYSLEDRILWQDFADRCLEETLALAPLCQDIDVFVGTPVRDGSRLYNGLVLLAGGQPQGITLKQALPNYNVFYEERQWTPWAQGAICLHGLPAGSLIYQLPYGRVGAEICEDLWSMDAPSRRHVRHGAEIVVNGAASPFTAGKQIRRRQMVRSATETLLAVYGYANLLGCDSSRVVFDGSAMISAPGGVYVEGPRLSPDPLTLTTAVIDLDAVASLRAANNTWRDAVEQVDSQPPNEVIVDRPFTPLGHETLPVPSGGTYYLPDTSGATETTDDLLDEILDALTLGVRDYFCRAGVFERFLLALSGGRDSALTLVVAWRAALAMGPDAEPGRLIACRYLPTQDFSSAETRNAALRLAEELNVPCEVVSIQQEWELARKSLQRMVGEGQAVAPIALENAQARIRAALMLGWANSARGLVLVTSNMSEAAVGYFTTGGDNQGGFAPISGIPKTLVNRLLERARHRFGLTSLDAITALPPSAELAAGQTDEAELMPYAVLDDILFLFAADRRAPKDIWRLICAKYPNHDPEQLREWVITFVTRFAANQWKRDQCPAGLKILELDLDPRSGFRFPVLQSVEDDLQPLRTAKHPGNKE